MTYFLQEWQTLTVPGSATFNEKQQSILDRLEAGGILSILPLRDGLRIQTFSHVGTIEIGSIRIHIRPKIAPAALHVLAAYALDCRQMLRFDPATVPLEDSTFLDLLGWLLLEEVDDILAEGLFQEYLPREEWLSTPRGRILVESIARHPFRANLRLSCRHVPRSADHALNQLMLACLGELRASVRQPALAFELGARELALNERIERRGLDSDLLDDVTVQIDRRSAYYSGIVRIAELLLRARSASTTQQDDHAPIPGHLFDMNVLFERFVARLLQEFGPPDLVIQPQESLKEAYEYTDNPHRWHIPGLRPDFIVRRRADRRAVLVIDTKYKALSGQRPSAADLYQTSLYSMAFGARPVPVHIVYPAVSPDHRIPSLVFRGFAGGDARARVSLRGLSLPQCTAWIRQRNRPALQSLVAKLLQGPNEGAAIA